jgi:hypothetical protein
MKDPSTVARRATGMAMILTPIAWLASAIVAPQFATDEGAQLAVIAQHPDRWYAFALLTLVGAMLLVPALMGVTGLLRERAPLAGYVGGSLAVLGTLVAIGDSLEQLVIWQMGAGDRGQMAALLTRLDDAAGLTLIFTIGALALLVGTVTLAVGLVRARIAPLWAAACLPLAMVVNVAGFAAASRSIVAASCVILLAALAPLAAALRSAGDQGRAARGLAVGRGRRSALDVAHPGQ